MRRITVSLVVAAATAALLGACASKEPAEKAAQPAAAPPPKVEPVKVAEATPQQRASIKTELAAGYYERGQFDVALDVLREAEQIDPNNPKIFDIYGLVYTMLAETPKAEASFRARSRSPRTIPRSARTGARSCAASGRERESIAEFEAAIRDPLYKSPEIAYINAGKCTLALGDSKKAEEYFRRALAASPNNASPLSARADRVQGDADARRRAFWLRPAVQAAVPRPEALYLGLCVERKLGDRQAELSYASQLRNRYPDAPETREIDSGTCG